MRSQKNRGGTDLKETVLWTNPNQTTSFTTKSVDLTQSIDDFDYIGVYSRVSTANSSTSYSLFNKDEFKNYLQTGTQINATMGARVNGNSYYSRGVYYVNNTRVTFQSCYQLGAGGTYYDNMVIPTKIVGLK